MLVFGTRPEAIKMCPLVLELQKHKEFECIVCLTGQHKEMLEQVMKAFGVESDYNLEIMRQQQTLTTITTGVLQGLEPILKAEKPDMVLVHGDTTTSFAAGLAAFYQQIAVGHVEAGLRTGDIYSPFPEEMNRSVTAHCSPAPLKSHLPSASDLLLLSLPEHLCKVSTDVLSFSTRFHDLFKILAYPKTGCQAFPRKIPVRSVCRTLRFPGRSPA